MILYLKRPYPSRYGMPVLSSVRTDIFLTPYFSKCLQCDFCNDWCCSFGVDVEKRIYQNIMTHAAGLAPMIELSPEEWFEPEVEEDEGMPGGLVYRTVAHQGACVFLGRNTRGCLLHSYALKIGMDYHDLKPMVSALFPLSFDDKTLFPADEVTDQELVCTGQGESLYRGVRHELQYYFGTSFVEELDQLEKKVRSH